jgi:sugar phosphate isomerase/epimerase
MRFCVQTATLPELGVPEVIEKLSLHGYDAVEWRLHDEYHLKPAAIVAEAKRVKPLLDDHGLAVSCLMGYVPLGDLDTHRRVAEACAYLDCPRFRPGAVVYDGTRPYRELFGRALDDLSRMVDAIAGCGAKPVIETHFGTIAPSAALAKRLVEPFDPGVIGVNFDPANMIVEGREPWAMALELLGEHLDYVHAKNLCWTREKGHWRWVFASLADGQVDWPDVLRCLHRVGFDGDLSVEDFYGVPIRTRGFVGEDLTQTLDSYRGVDERLSENLAYLRHCEVAARDI